jgi:hypothetical protein
VLTTPLTSRVDRGEVPINTSVGRRIYDLAQDCVDPQFVATVERVIQQDGTIGDAEQPHSMWCQLRAQPAPWVRGRLFSRFMSWKIDYLNW